MSEETNNIQQEVESSNGIRHLINFEIIYRTVILNWHWFVLSLLVCLAIAFIKLRYTPSVYETYAKMYVKGENEGRSNSNNIKSTSTLGILNQNYGLDNEMQIIKSSNIAAQAVKDLKLYTTYKSKGRLVDVPIYKSQPVTVDIDPVHLEKLNMPINLSITREENAYHIEGTYYISTDALNSKGPYGINRTVPTFPVTIKTNAGYLTFNTNQGVLNEGATLLVTISPLQKIAEHYSNGLAVIQSTREGSILNLSMRDIIPQRGLDYLQQLVVCYNRQANEDKNEVAVRTEEFINERLTKINGELGNTEGAIENYKRRNNIINFKTDANESSASANTAEQKLYDINAQIALIDNISQYVTRPSNKYQLMPINVGMEDNSVSQLISEYNKIVQQRNRILRSAAENSPAVEPLTQQLDELASSINMTLTQARNNAVFQRNIAAQQHGQYMNKVSRTPEQERILTQIGRQQEVKSGLYLMLLQKREENSISLAATADKGKLIDMPKFGGKVAPNTKMIYLTALAIGLSIPALLILISLFFRYKIEGHEDVVNLTKLPIIGEVAIANETAKTKADIVVHENKNSQMEEIFRAMRTNLQFMLKENEKVILFTSTTSGEGKTFNVANLAVSFALLNKKVIIIGLDIRKPRLAELFEIKDHHHGITPLLTMENPGREDIHDQILPSGVHSNLDLLMAGPIPPNPTELISRPSLERIMQILREEYDYIIVDTAPVGLVTDTLQIGRVCDTTIYICRADYTPKQSFELVNGLYNDKKLPNMSIVINGIDMSKRKYGYYYGYGRYGKYGRYGHYGKYGRTYGNGNSSTFGHYGTYGIYGSYNNSRYGDQNDDSVKR